MASTERNPTSMIPEGIDDEQRFSKCFYAYQESTENHAVGASLFSDIDASSSSVCRSAEDWGILWTHVFPLHISGYLCVRDIIEVARVCRMGHSAVQQPWVWRSLAVHHHSVQPVALERTFSIAARQWGEERPTETIQRLRVYNTPPLLTEVNRRTSEHRVRFLVGSTAYTTAGGGEDASSEEVETGEPDAPSNDEGTDEFDTAQQPHDVDAAILSSAAVPTVAAATAVAAFAPASSSTKAEEVGSSAPRSSRAALPSSTSPRFLWQTAAAAMPSPSSPVSSPPPEDDKAAGTPAVPSSALLPREAEARGSTPLLSMTTLAAAPPRGAAKPNLYASPQSGMLTSLTEGQCSSPILNNNGTGSSSGEKWRAMRWATTQECLPPPSPAQLKSTVTSTEAPAVGDVSPRASFSAGSLRRHPSYVLEMATEVAVDGPASPLPAASFSSAASRDSSFRQVALSTPVVYSFTLCRATAERTVLHSVPEFPWKMFTQYLHINRVQRSLSQLAALSNTARAELCQGGTWDAAYGALSRAIHVLFQSGGCRSVEHLTHLAETLVRRASLCRHRGHLYVLAAFADLSVAWMLCPDSTSSSDLVQLCAREELSHESPATWLQRCNDAAHIASPVALPSIIAQVPTLFPQNRTLCFCAMLTFYMYAKRTLRHSLTHLLCRGAECVTPGTEEELLMTALREVAVAQQSKEVTSAQRACATADYAFSLLPLHVRSAAETLTAAWVRDCFPPDGPASTETITGWADVAPESLSYIRSTPLEVRWLAWLACEVRWFAYEELMGSLPGQTALLSIVFGPTTHSRADGLVRLSMQYANADVHSEDLRPALPYGTSRGHLAQSLLESALQLRPLHPSAAVLLARMHARDVESLGRANAVLTDSIHAWAQRFSMLEMRGSAEVRRSAAAKDQQTLPGREGTDVLAYLHRRDRRPEVCFIPSELLVERSRCLHTIADMAEATEQHPNLSYPYQMRAAMAMDRGYHLAAVMELSRIIALTMDPNDVALRVRFLQDAIAMAASAIEVGASSEAAEGTADLTPTATATAYDGNHISDGGLVLASNVNASPLSSLQLVPLYRAWMAKMLGFLTLLRPPESTCPGSQQLRTRFLGREWLAAPSGAWPPTSSEVHVSRVASIAFSDGDEEDALVSAAAVGFDAVYVRAFLEDLLSPTALPFGVMAIDSGARTPALTH
ncbi:hypothetical protein, unknown function [Leishmania braziliensis MHOM/BR/75/M2904]|uniref:Calcium-transporting P-type ATPase N-terminal autoinhibitory domain-containing protein n=2 Tax=Leishmania braziliensis TaxID=5660 RepID=A4HH51_LEIBR|nr:hypothetical protein, unknown function [Leishmania braziliensis MHOM/BR/75/M2904]CAM39900.1 hypothetical protein, unknown function [Leishmania braziliensis MHOM/BR/75/M2904]